MHMLISRRAIAAFSVIKGINRMIGKIKALILAAGFVTAQASASLITVDFENTVPPSSTLGYVTIGAPTYIEEGISLTASGAQNGSTNQVAAANDGWQNFRGSSNGTIVGGAAGQFTGATITIASSAPLFSILSIDLAEFVNNEPISATSVSFVGNSISGVLNATFNLDGLSDGNGPITDFETFVFGSAWEELTSVVMTGLGGSAYYSFDNIRILNATGNGQDPVNVAAPAPILLCSSLLFALSVFRRIQK